MQDYSRHLSYRYGLFILLFTLASNRFYLFAAPVHKESSLMIEKKEKALRLYQRKRYAQANEEIEFLLPLLKHKIDRSKFEFYQAYCNFHQKKYLVSSNQFHLFIEQYPSSPEVEEALFMRGYSLSFENVDIRLDQTATYDAIGYLEHYLAVYPTGVYLHKASEALQSLQDRLMRKRFEAAALYVRLGYYNAAIVALKNFDQAYPEASLKEKVLRLLIKSYEKLAANASNKERKQELVSYSCSFAQQLNRYLSSKKSDALEKNSKKRTLKR